MKALLASPHLQKLVCLKLSGNTGGAAVAALTDPGVLPGLAVCWLPDGVSKRQYEKLVSARGDIFLGGPR